MESRGGRGASLSSASRQKPVLPLAQSTDDALSAHPSAAATVLPLWPRADSRMPVPFVSLRHVVAQAANSRVAEFFERGQFILGSDVAAFEKKFAEQMGGGHAIGVGNGTNAIELCLRDAGATGEVLTSALTAPFTATAILAAGAKPRFADVDPLTLQIDPDDAGNRITRRTAALLPVHLYGQPCTADVLAKCGPLLIQDACQAHGARLRGRPLTAFGNYVAYSFYPTKNLGCLGDGGAIV